MVNFWNIFNVFESVATKNKLSGTPGNILNINVSGIQVSNKTDSVIIEKTSEIFLL